MKTNKKRTIGTVYVNNLAYFCLNIVRIADEDGRELPICGYLCVSQSPINLNEIVDNQDYTPLYPSPVIIIGGSFVGNYKGTGGFLIEYIEIEDGEFDKPVTKRISDFDNHI